MSTTVVGHASPVDQTSRRWIQLIAGIVCMVAAANIQYSWTLFVPEIQKTFGWERAAIQTTFTIFVIVQTWLTPIEGSSTASARASWFSSAGSSPAWPVISLRRHAQRLSRRRLRRHQRCVYATLRQQRHQVVPGPSRPRRGPVSGRLRRRSALTIIPIANAIAAGGFRDAFFWYGIIQGDHHGGGPFLRAAEGRDQGVKADCAEPPRLHARRGLKTPLFYLLFAMFILTVTGGLMAVAQLGPMAQDLGVKDKPVDLGFVVMAALPFALLLDRVMNGVSRPLFGCVSDYIGRENTMFIAFLMEGLGIIALAKYGSNPWAFIILSGVVFLAWGEVYSLFSATSADAFGTKNIGTIYGVLYCAKGIGALLVPMANYIQEATGTWSTVLYTVSVMDIMAALCALLLLKPALRRHHSRLASKAAAAETPRRAARGWCRRSSSALRERGQRGATLGTGAPFLCRRVDRPRT